MMNQRIIKRIMIFTTILTILFGIFVIFTSTNMINKLSGDSFYKTIHVNSVINGTDGGYIKLIRNEEFPLTYEWASFDKQNTDNKHIYFSIDENQRLAIPLHITIPMKVEKGNKIIEYEINYNSGKIINGQFDFVII